MRPKTYWLRIAANGQAIFYCMKYLFTSIPMKVAVLGGVVHNSQAMHALPKQVA